MQYLSFAKGWRAFPSPFAGHMVTQVFVLCVSNAENSPMVMSGLGGSLRLQIVFPETIPLPINIIICQTQLCFTMDGTLKCFLLRHCKWQEGTGSLREKKKMV